MDTRAIQTIEIILFVVGIYATLWLIITIFSWIKSLIEKHKTNIRNKVLEDFQIDYDLDGSMNKYRMVIEEFNNEKESGFLEKYFVKDDFELMGRFNNYLGICPGCGKGYLIVRKGRHGKFIGCLSYPNCKYTKNFEEAKSEYKMAVKEQITADFKRAYN